MISHCAVLAILLATLPNGQSIFGSGGEAGGPPSPYTQIPRPRAPIKKQDLVLIVVQERSQAGMDAQLDSRRRTELSMLLDQFVRISDGKYLKPDLAPQPEIEMEGELFTQAQGRTNRNDRITTRITARVIDVLENGNVRLEARRERQINDEVTVITLSGEAPIFAVTEDYQISSDRLADLKISISGEGPVSSTTGWTWLTWIAGLIWPF